MMYDIIVRLIARYVSCYILRQNDGFILCYRNRVRYDVRYHRASNRSLCFVLHPSPGRRFYPVLQESCATILYRKRNMSCAHNNTHDDVLIDEVMRPGYSEREAGVEEVRGATAHAAHWLRITNANAQSASVYNTTGTCTLRSQSLHTLTLHHTRGYQSHYTIPQGPVHSGHKVYTRSLSTIPEDISLTIQYHRDLYTPVTKFTHAHSPPYQRNPNISITIQYHRDLYTPVTKFTHAHSPPYQRISVSLYNTTGTCTLRSQSLHTLTLHHTRGYQSHYTIPQGPVHSGHKVYTRSLSTIPEDISITIQYHRDLYTPVTKFTHAHSPPYQRILFHISVSLYNKYIRDPSSSPLYQRTLQYISLTIQ
ncbi:hypothetical protein J6590_065173 [Homalodisca vitripennis]|nr:hypothetical protein J6590_065173 [Homalodisca vitripennis]